MSDPTHIGRYRLLEPIGRGGRGVLYRGIDPLLDREVAIKVMSAEFLNEIGDEARARFFREAKAAAKLQHRNIVTVFEYGDDHGVGYIVMELLKGQSLATRMKAGPIDLDEKLDVMTEVCSGLEFAHRHGVVHRDVKPGTIWLSDVGTVKLLDFGIAHLGAATLSGGREMLGTLAYMAPEQVAGSPVDGRADVFSAAVVLFELLAGRRPFDADSPAATSRRILNDEPLSLDAVAPDVPVQLRALVMKGLSKAPEDRFQSADDMAAELQALRLALRPIGGTVVNREVPVLPPKPIRPASPGSSITWPPAMWFSIGGAVVTILAVGGLFAASHAKRPSPSGPPPAPPTSTTPPPRVSVLVKSDPSAAYIAIDGKETGQLTPATVSLTPEVQHRLAVSKSGFTSAELTPTADDLRDGSIRFKLKAETPVERMIRVVAKSPSDARYPFEVRDADTDAVISSMKTDHSFTLRAGQRIRLFNAENFLNFPVPKEMLAAGVVTPPGLGLLWVTVPPGAAWGGCPIYVDGLPFGHAFDHHSAAVGPHLVEFKCSAGTRLVPTPTTCIVKAGPEPTPCLGG